MFQYGDESEVVGMALSFQPLIVYHGISRTTGGRLSDNREAAEWYARENNGHIVEHYVEHGQRCKATRPALVRAITHAKEAGAFLVVPMFNPHARDSVFLTLLWKSDVVFLACDNPHANRTTLPLLASVVVEESQKISARAKAALAKRRRRKGRLGTPTNLTDEGRRRGAEAAHRKADRCVNDALTARLKGWRDEEKSLREIAAILNAEKGPTDAKAPWSHTRVRRLFMRIDELERAHAARRAEWIAAGSPRRPRPKRRQQSE